MKVRRLLVVCGVMLSLCGSGGLGWRWIAPTAAATESAEAKAAAKAAKAKEREAQRLARQAEQEAKARAKAQAAAHREAERAATSRAKAERAAERAAARQTTAEAQSAKAAQREAERQAREVAVVEKKRAKLLVTQERQRQADEQRAAATAEREAKKTEARSLRDARRSEWSETVVSERDEAQQALDKHLEVLGFRIGGNVTTLAAWQRPDAAALNAGTRVRGILGDQLADVVPTPSESQFGFFIDQIELDVERDFNRVIGFRLDLDVSPHRDANGDGDNDDVRDIVDLEQAYVEFTPSESLRLALGRFNAGFGLDPVDRADLPTVSFNSLHRFLVPNQLTGIKIGLADDEWSGNLFVVQGIDNQDVNQKTVVPTLGVHLERRWGGDGEESAVRLAAAAGPQTASDGAWTVLGDLTGDFFIVPALRLGVEGVYRREYKVGCGDGSGDCTYYGGTLQAVMPVHPQVSLTARAGYLRDLNNGPRTGTNESILDGTFAVNYAPIRRGRVGVEYRYELARFHAALAARKATQTHGVGLLASYSF